MKLLTNSNEKMTKKSKFYDLIKKLKWYEKHLKGSKCLMLEGELVTNPELLSICLKKNISILLWCVLSTTRINLRHEIVVKVIIATHSNCINTLAKIICSSTLISKIIYQLGHCPLVILNLSSKTNSLSLQSRNNNDYVVTKMEKKLSCDDI
jgi:hypothetical protein